MYKGTSGREQESIIGFYNKVYMVAMKSTILQFAPNKVSEPFFFIVNGSLYTNQVALSWCPQHEVTRSVPFSHCWLLCPPPLPSILSVFPGRRIVRVKCLSLELNTLIWPGLERGPFDPESTFFHHPTYHGLHSSFRTIQQMWYLVNSMSEKYSRFLLEYRSLT